MIDYNYYIIRQEVDEEKARYWSFERNAWVNDILDASPVDTAVLNFGRPLPIEGATGVIEISKLGNHPGRFWGVSTEGVIINQETL